MISRERHCFASHREQSPVPAHTTHTLMQNCTHTNTTHTSRWPVRTVNNLNARAQTTTPIGPVSAVCVNLHLRGRHPSSSAKRRGPWVRTLPFWSAGFSQLFQRVVANGRCDVRLVCTATESVITPQLSRTQNAERSSINSVVGCCCVWCLSVCETIVNRCGARTRREESSTELVGLVHSAP